MFKELLMSKFETYLLDEKLEQDTSEEIVNDNQSQETEYPPGFFSAL